MPNTPVKIQQQLGISEESLTNWESIKNWGKLPSGIHVGKREIIFPRIDKAAIDKSAKNVADAAEAQEKKDTKATADKAAGTLPEGIVDLISIDDFAKVQLRVAEVLEAERIKGADKLLKLQIKIGEERRQIVAGIAKHYTPEELIGKKIVVVANLKPAKLRGVESQGMLLAASNPEKLTLLTVDRDIESGARIK